MKKLFFTILITFYSFYLFSQATNQSGSLVGKSFITKTSIIINPYDPSKEKNDNDIDKSIHFLINDGIKFYIYKVLDSGYVISVWDFNTKDIAQNIFYQSLPCDNFYELDNPIPNKDDYYKMSKNIVGLKVDSPTIKSSPFSKYDQLAYVDSWANNMQFFIPLKDFNDNCESIYPKAHSFTWGFLTLPIKARFGNAKGPFTFEEKVNFGISLGIKFQHVSKVYKASNILGGISVSGVKIDNTTNVATTTSASPAASSSASALSFSGGYMFQYDTFQVGVFTGFDFTSQTPNLNWAYQGKPWIGFAIGVSLFGESKTAASTNQSQGNNIKL